MCYVLCTIIYVEREQGILQLQGSSSATVVKGHGIFSKHTHEHVYCRCISGRLQVGNSMPMANNPFNNKATARLSSCLARMLLITFMTLAESTVSSGDRLAARWEARRGFSFRSRGSWIS